MYNAKQDKIAVCFCSYSCRFHDSDIDDSSTSFAQLQAAMLGACEGQGEWPAKLAAGISVALEFAVANPEAARALAIDAHADWPGRGDSPGMLARLRDMLTGVVPRDRRLPASTEEALIAGVVAAVAGHLRRDRLDRLTETGPDLILLVLLPYLGFAEAKKWAQSAAPRGKSGP